MSSPTRILSFRRRSSPRNRPPFPSRLHFPVRCYCCCCCCFYCLSEPTCDICLCHCERRVLSLLCVCLSVCMLAGRPGAKKSPLAGAAATPDSLPDADDPQQAQPTPPPHRPSPYIYHLDERYTTQQPAAVPHRYLAPQEMTLLAPPVGSGVGVGAHSARSPISGT